MIVPLISRQPPLIRPLVRRGVSAVSAGPAVGRDGPGNWYVPESSADFTALSLAAPDRLCLCQEASGDLASAIGSLTLAVNATGHLYQQSVTGWTRKFVGLDGATAGQSWRTTDAALDLAAGESFAVLAYVAATTPAANRVLFSAQGGNDVAQIAATTGVPRTLHNNTATAGAVAMGGLTTVRQVLWYRNGTADASGMVTDAESISGTHNESARTGQIRCLGPTGTALPPELRCCLLAFYKGANAERDWPAYLATLRAA